MANPKLPKNTALNSIGITEKRGPTGMEMVLMQLMKEERLRGLSKNQ